TLLNEIITTGPARAWPLPGKPLGRILLEQSNPQRRAALVLTSLFLALLLPVLLGTLLLDVALVAFGVLPVLVLALALRAFSLACRPTLRFHEHGVSQVTRTGARELLSTEIGTLVWKSGTEVCCAPLPGLARPTIHSTAPFHEDENVIGLR